MRTLPSLPRSALLTVLCCVSLAGCRGCFDDGSDPERTLCESAVPWAPLDVHWGPMPEGDSDSTAQALPVDVSKNSATVSPMLEFHYNVPFTGGPVSGVRIGVGDTCYFEAPIDLGRASDTPSDGYEDADQIHNEAIWRATAAQEQTGLLSLTGVLPEWLNLPDAIESQYRYQVRGNDGRWSPTQGQGKLTLCTADDDCTPGNPDGVVGGGGGGGDGLDGGEDNVWKDTWLFVESDKAVQMRMSLIRTDGTKHYVKVQYRVNSSDQIYCSTCNGYHVYATTDAFSYRINFPAGFTLGQVYEMPHELEIDLTGDNKWDSTVMRPTYQGAINRYFPYSCVDDNSSGSRCSSSFESEVPNDSSHRFTATNNASP